MSRPDTFDATTYGWGDATKDQATAVQQAHDAAAAWAKAYNKANPGLPVPAPGRVRLPGVMAPSAFNSPVYADSPSVEFIGDGPASRIGASATNGVIPFVIGVPRVSANGFTPGPAVRPDLFGRLDSTAASAAGQRWGLEIGPTFLWQVGGAFDRGGTSPKWGSQVLDGYAETRQLTVEVAFAAPPGQTAVAPGFFVGCGQSTGAPWAPWMINSWAGGWSVGLTTQAVPYGPTCSTTATFQLPVGTGTRRLTAQMDATTATPTIAVWVDGVRVPIDSTTIQGDPGPAATRTFVRNVNWAFLAGQTLGGVTPPFGQKPVPWTLLGLATSGSLRYDSTGAVGSAQARLDGVANVPDAYRYFPAGNQSAAVTDPKFIASLALDDNPTLAARHMRVANPSGHYSLAFIGDPNQYGAGVGEGAQTGNKLKDLAIGSGLYGAGVLMAGGVLGCRYEGCQISGGPYAIATPPQGANYGHVIRDCTLQASEACILGWFSSYLLRDCTLVRTGRVGILTKGSSIDVDNLNVAFSSANQESLAQHMQGEWGGMYFYRAVYVDNEDIPFSRSGILCQRSPYTTTRLRLTDVYLAQVGTGLPFIDLDDSVASTNTGGWSPAVLIASGLSTGNVGAAARMNGPSWTGAVRDSILPAPQSVGTFGAPIVQYISPTTGLAVPAVPVPVVPVPVTPPVVNPPTPPGPTPVSTGNSAVPK